MIKVRLFGLLRLNSGIKEMSLEAGSVKDLYAALEKASDKITKRELESCVLLVNGKQQSKKCPLCEGDEVMLLSPIAGG